MSERLIIDEQYKKGKDVIHYVVYKSETGAGNDEVLQHKIMGMTETAHVTLHPDGAVNLRIRLTGAHLRHAIETGLVDWKPAPSLRVNRFLSKVRSKI
ncbi:MAG: hypothetical protein LGR52_05625 [Candidatus Thiosymbion ectosymbiont of Robbea hypermnestra]|nr:hypothetical protein [Candidatus Thiosymbion ectosymbiont of Robbea hypermnestra]